jgi:hypothetical protein
MIGLRNQLTLAVFLGILSASVGVCDEADTKKIRTPAKKDISTAFESRIVSQMVPPKSPQVSFQWSYVNRWDIPLVVERFDESCGCLKGILNQDPVAPGKTGQIRATFTPGSYRGTIRKSFYVRFVGHERAVELVAEAIVPSSVELSAHELSWPTTVESKSQTIEVTSGTDDDFHITSLDGISDTQYQITQEVITPARHYRIHITPKEGIKEGIQTLILKTDSPDPRDQAMAVFLHFRPSGARAQTAATR